VSAVTLPVEHGLVIAAVLFAVGLAGVIVRRNLIFVLLSLEIMMNAAAFALVVAGARWAEADGQLMYVIALTVAAAEVALGLGLLLQLEQRARTVDVDVASRMAG
jgi:NADH-quinone oxidoreductase subunit K